MNCIGIAAKLIIARVDAYLTENGKAGNLNSYPALNRALATIKDEDVKRWAEAGASVNGNPEPGAKDDFGVERYFRAQELFGGGDILLSLMELCAAELIYPELSACLKENFGYGPCLHLAALLEGKEGLTYGETCDLAARARRLLVLDIKTEPLEYAPVSMDEKLMGFLNGSDTVNVKLSDFTLLYPKNDETLHKPFTDEELMTAGVEHFKKGGKVLCITGSGGRRFTARQVAGGIGKDFLFINISDLIREAGKDGLEALRDTLMREAFLDEAGICIHGFSEQFITGGRSDEERGKRDMEVLARMLFSPMVRENIPLILCVDKVRYLPGRDILPGMMCISIPVERDFEDRKKVWKGLFDLYGLSFDPASFASRYRMNPREASAAVRACLEEKKISGSGGKTEEQLFANVILEGTEKDESGTGRVIYPDVKLEDVKLKDGTKQILEDVLVSVLSGPVILDEWKLRKRYPYGRGVSLLLVGPPGTGKTMSANAIASELSLPLYQVNLSNVVDKYIGETEKNLEKAFLFAEKNNVVLFFDEADALFGTRSEIQDAKDRYANTEVSYLLQRMEAYDGIVIMATNLKGNIDPAFMRRIRFVARFENPDEEMRRAIWESCLTDSVPREEIDTEYLAAQFDQFTGSIIKSVFLNACSKAAGEGKKLNMRHLVYAIKLEKEKESAVGFTRDTLGKYAYLL